MTESELLDKLRQLETELHQEHTRRNVSCMEMLLHPDFNEIGRSGRRYSRTEVLAELTSTGEQLPVIVSRGFEVTRLSENLVLLSYVSAYLDATGSPHRHTLRSSLWMLTADGWKMRFHQGTPTDGFPQSAD